MLLVVMAILPEPPELLQFLEPYPSHIRDLMRGARERMLEILPPVSEIVYDANSAAIVGFSFTHRATDNFIHMPAYSNHVNLGFTWWARLFDSEGRLLGKGSQVRHLTLTCLEMLDEPYVLDLIDQAATLAPRPSEPLVPTSIIKVMAGTKRRPR